MAIEIVSFPIKNCVFSSVFCKRLPEGNSHDSAYDRGTCQALITLSSLHSCQVRASPLRRIYRQRTVRLQNTKSLSIQVY